MQSSQLRFRSFGATFASGTHESLDDNGGYFFESRATEWTVLDAHLCGTFCDLSARSHGDVKTAVFIRCTEDELPEGVQKTIAWRTVTDFAHDVPF